MSAFKSSIVFGNAEESYETPPASPPRTQKQHATDSVNQSQIVFGSEPTEIAETPIKRSKAFAYVCTD